MFKVSARTVLELGSELISSDIIAFYELIKNGFDARSKNGVEIQFEIIVRRNVVLALKHRLERGLDTLDAIKQSALKALLPGAASVQFEKATALLAAALSTSELSSALDAVHALNSITVSDTGTGMSVADLTDCFLVIGTASRKREVNQAIAGGALMSPFLGEKGIGRLSAMRLGHRLRVETAKCDDKKLNILEIDWRRFEDVDAMLDEIDVTPTSGGSKLTADWSGTSIKISDLAEDWTRDRTIAMATSEFSKLTDPFLDPKKRPRVALIWNGERETIPWMDQALLANANAKVVGEFKIVDGRPELVCTAQAINLGFEHPVETQVRHITGDDLRSLVPGNSLEIPDQALLTVGPFKFEAYWFNRKLLTGIDSIGDQKAVRELQRQWSGILLFRDKFRVFPYGDDDDDWLELDRKALARTGYTLNKTQFVGRVEISRISNPELVDQTNREGLRETPEQQVFCEVIKFTVREFLYDFLGDMTAQYKNRIDPMPDVGIRVQSLEQRAETALKKLRKSVSGEHKATVEELQQAFFEFTELASKAQHRIEQVEKESHQMIEMAGVGLMVEVVAHELARASENALEQIETLRNSPNTPAIKIGLDSLKAQMKSLSKRIRILDPLSVSGRQRTEVFDLNQLIRETIEAHQSQFKRHDIVTTLNLSGSVLRIKAVKGMVVQVLENLISNSKYWMKLRKIREPAYKPSISISTESGTPGFVLEDNGPGIATENRERIFRLFFSLKEKGQRRGMGLYIARECAGYHEGSLELDDQPDEKSGRLHRFILTLPQKSLVA